MSSNQLLTDDLSLKSFKYETRGDYGKAIQIAEKVIELSPNSAQVKKQIINLRSKHLNSTRTISVSVAPIVNSEKFVSFNAALNAGAKAYKKKNYLDAIEHFRQALKENNDFAEIYFWIGLCHWKLKSLQAVIDSCNQAININQKYATVHNLKGIANKEMGFLDLAIEDFGTAIANNPSLYKAYFNRGILFKEKGNLSNSNSDFQRSIELIDQFLRSNPHDEEALAIRGDLFSLTNRKLEAKESYKTAKAIYDNKGDEEKDLNYDDRIKEGLSRHEKLIPSDKI